jgi:hypothetical protein
MTPSTIAAARTLTHLSTISVPPVALMSSSKYVHPSGEGTKKTFSNEMRVVPVSA